MALLGLVGLFFGSKRSLGSKMVGRCYLPVTWRAVWGLRERILVVRLALQLASDVGLPGIALTLAVRYAARGFPRWPQNTEFEKEETLNGLCGREAPFILCGKIAYPSPIQLTPPLLFHTQALGYERRSFHVRQRLSGVDH